ncbi:DUF1365 domain-containing protein [Pelagibius litoralis]|uniref:DUF1365 domain-containing protein n=2 Tax=Pelagibius litoralis TaxID=374515 RepID=A0A967F3B1_9PROT|nr:DUF1365 domain-containing protein [Pelagibius litoralis]
MHKRMRPFTHRFRYSVFSLFLDLDELPRLTRSLPLLSHNRFNIFSFRDSDHGPRDGTPLRPWAEAQLLAAGIDLEGGALRLLCFPRILGYVFNPLSVWFCHHRNGSLRAIIYEVKNTFGEQHCYLIPVAEDNRDNKPILQSCEKKFYVSPFIEMASAYRFRLREPQESLSILIRQAVAEGEVLLATLTGRRVAIDHGGLWRALLRYPLMTAKVMAAIHWEALWIWRKGGRFYRRGAPPAQAVTRAAP